MTERELIEKKLKEMTPIKMKKEVKVKGKNKGKTKRVDWINIYMNYKVYDHNMMGFKPYIDYDAMPIVINKKIYFIGGRKHLPIITYTPNGDKWEQLKMIDSLKPFG